MSLQYLWDMEMSLQYLWDMEINCKPFQLKDLYLPTQAAIVSYMLAVLRNCNLAVYYSMTL